jgi:hypothetical protein
MLDIKIWFLLHITQKVSTANFYETKQFEILFNRGANILKISESFGYKFQILFRKT